MSEAKWVLQLFEIEGSALATGRTNLAGQGGSGIGARQQGAGQLSAGL